MPDNRERLETARNGLARLWFIWGFVILLVVIVQSILGYYGEQLREAWSWFIPTIVPTCSLMLGVLGESAMRNEDDDLRTVKRTFYQLTRWISCGYLLILSLTICLAPFAPVNAVQLYTLSNYWLAPMQGIVGATIGVLVVSQQQPLEKQQMPG
jgi:hypothetical protein